MRTFLLMAVALAIGAASARAAFPEDSPEAAAAAYYEAIRSGDLDDLATRLHPEALASFKAMVLPAAEQVLGEGGEPADPETAALMESLAGGASLEALRAESDAAFFARFMRWVLRVHPALRDSLTGAVITPLGSVREGTTAHVVYRMKLDLLGLQANRVDVLSLQRDETGAWKLLLTGDLEGLGNLFSPAP